VYAHQSRELIFNSRCDISIHNILYQILPYAIDRIGNSLIETNSSPNVPKRSSKFRCITSRPFTYQTEFGLEDPFLYNNNASLLFFTNSYSHLLTLNNHRVLFINSQSVIVAGDKRQGGPLVASPNPIYPATNHKALILPVLPLQTLQMSYCISCIHSNYLANHISPTGYSAAEKEGFQLYYIP
jgi:hypothetical protein